MLRRGLGFVSPLREPFGKLLGRRIVERRIASGLLGGRLGVRGLELAFALSACSPSTSNWSQG